MVVAGALAYLVAGGIGDNLVYFMTPTEVLAKGEAAYETPLRLMGQVEPGTVDWRAEDLTLRFTITDDRHALPVLSEGAPPQMFQDGIDVIVEGRMEREGFFRATSLMVKHSNEYAPPEGDDHPPVQPLTDGGDGDGP
jgi:cytochrome c-type biogenesis protein CcmE